MLAFKAIAANADSIPTLIFDEIDTGISGHIAAVVGEKMVSIADNHQVLCVTQSLPPKDSGPCGRTLYGAEAGRWTDYQNKPEAAGNGGNGTELHRPYDERAWRIQS